MRHWLRLHRVALLGTIKLFLQSPLTSMLNLLVVGISVALPLGLFTLVSNLQTLSDRVPAEAQITVFLLPDSGAGDVARVKKLLEGLTGVVDVKLLSKQVALESLQSSSGMRELLAGLDGNPLPDAFSLRTVEGQLSDAALQTIKADQAVEFLQQDSDWAKRLEGFVALGRESVLTIAVLFGTGLLLITANLVRMQILTRRDEIEVSKLIGATDSFIRRPFLYFAATQGLLGGGIGIGVVAIALSRLNEPVLALAKLYNESFTLHLPAAWSLMAILVAVMAFSLLGAILSVSRHLREFDC